MDDDLPTLLHDLFLIFSILCGGFLGILIGAWLGDKMNERRSHHD